MAGRAGVYRWDEIPGRWEFMGCVPKAGTIAGSFPAFGRYALLVDNVAPVAGEPETAEAGAALAIPIDEAGSGVDTESIRLTLNGAPVDAAYQKDSARIIWIPQEGFAPGDDVLRLELTDLAGNPASWERQVDLAKLLPVPSQYILYQNFPNPFNPQTAIRFEIPEEMDVRFTVYNALGQEVRNLLTDRVAPGRYTVVWDARDNTGRFAGAGIYLYRLETPRAALSRKMLLLK